MKCFIHIDADAVGICSACNKGLCPQCAEDLGHSIACSSSACIEKAKIIERTIFNNSVSFSASRKSIYIMPLFFGFIGALTIAAGLQDGSFFNVSVMAGSVFSVVGLILLIINVKWASKLKN